MNAHSVVTLAATLTWDDVRQEYSKLQQMGKDDEPGFIQRAGLECHIGRAHAFNLMRLAANLPLLEKHKPESQRAALALIPKKPRTATTPEPVSIGEEAPTLEQRRDSDIKPRQFTDRAKFNTAFYQVSATLSAAMKVLEALNSKPQLVETKKCQEGLATMERYAVAIHDNIKRLIKQERQWLLPCGTPTGFTGRMSDAELDIKRKECERIDRKNARARERRYEKWKKADAEGRSGP